MCHNVNAVIRLWKGVSTLMWIYNEKENVLVNLDMADSVRLRGGDTYASVSDGYTLLAEGDHIDAIVECLTAGYRVAEVGIDV